MANYNVLKSAIQTAVDWDNNSKQISGNDMLAILLSIINNTVATGYLLAGVAITSTNPGTPDQNVAYLAADAGTYSNFPDANNHPLVVNSGELCVFLWNGSWTKQSMSVGGGGGGQTPLVVVGRASAFISAAGEYVFVPTDGTTFEQAKSAFLSGRLVFVKDGSGRFPDDIAMIISVNSIGVVRMSFDVIHMFGPDGLSLVSSWYRDLPV